MYLVQLIDYMGNVVRVFINPTKPTRTQAKLVANNSSLLIPTTPSNAAIEDLPDGWNFHNGNSFAGRMIFSKLESTEKLDDFVKLLPIDFSKP